MQEKGEPEPVELIRDLRVEERQQSTHIIHAVHLREDRAHSNKFLPSKSPKMSQKLAYLRAESGLLVKVALHKVTIFAGCDFTPERDKSCLFSVFSFLDFHQPVLRLPLTSLWFRCSTAGL